MTEKVAPTDFPIHALLAQRWSPRVFAPTLLAAEQVDSLIEAARWAASSANSQPWRFVVGHRSDATFEALAHCLSEGNRWAVHAPLLMLVAAHTQVGERKLSHAWFDCGLAVGNLMLQAEAQGLRVHPMAGFSSDLARATFAMPATVAPIVMLAVGHPSDDIGTLPDYLQAREQSPRVRLPHAQLIVTDNQW